ncbi:hypothetical protein GGX14DRAFT_556130 [Mycena pura]|uniref:Uncharacterized protein n=1 Tax=Mycena pura TaxID=153505 RepID=A0AAD6YP35_9AGAR|nr:hypothetical protein GGX14DRAFT_556130 [Mycena pura]
MAPTHNAGATLASISLSASRTQSARQTHPTSTSDNFPLSHPPPSLWTLKVSTCGVCGKQDLKDVDRQQHMGRHQAYERANVRDPSIKAGTVWVLNQQSKAVFVLTLD